MHVNARYESYHILEETGKRNSVLRLVNLWVTVCDWPYSQFVFFSFDIKLNKHLVANYSVEYLDRRESF